MSNQVVQDESTYRQQIDRQGFGIIEGVVSANEVERLRAAIRALPEGEEIRRRTNVYGVRNLLAVCPTTQALATSPAMRALVTPVLGEDCFAVRATFFDKLGEANWNVSYHQDSVIAVRERIETEGFTAWSEKASVWQVRPPVEVLQRMLALRIHLDDCPAENGALRILKGSHAQRWPREEIQRCKEESTEVVCEVGIGGVLAMRPLALHASSASTQSGHRRVIHIEYARGELPGNLEWNQRVR